MTNGQIADAFDEVADLLEFQGENLFRVRAYRAASRAIRDHPDSIAQLVDDAADLTKIGGIGKDLASKCVAMVHTGKLSQLETLREQIPASVLALLRIPGLGPKKAAMLYRELGIESLEQLRHACENRTVRDLKGFGAKTEQTILEGLAFAETSQDRILWAKADALAVEVKSYLGGCQEVVKLEVAGSYRRGKETIGDLDILVVSPDPSTVMDHWALFPRVAETMLRGDTKMTVRLDTGLQADLRVVPAESFGAALQYFTGSKEHNVVVRGRAKQLGLRLNEYGVYQSSSGEYVAGATEEEVYAAVGLPWFPPELRENRQEFAWAERDELPQLVTVADIRGDLHMHTTATDGKATLEQMVDAARQRGLNYLAITDHSQRVTMAGGLDAKRVLAQWKEIDRLNQRFEGEFTVLKGIECDILESGGMDLSDDVLAQADWVLASVHYGQKQPREQITARILGALENPHVSAIAHPTGRLINRRDAYAVDMQSVMAAAKQHGKLLELNANPLRLDLNDVLCAAAKAMGIPIVINTDAHSVEGLSTMRYGVIQARRGGLTAQDVANSRPWTEVRRLIGTSCP